MHPRIWNKFLCDNTRLQLKGTLNGGQSFRWKKEKSSEHLEKEQYVGIFGGCVWWLIQENGHILYRVFDPCNGEANEEPLLKKTKLDNGNEKYEQLLYKYFQLNVNLNEYYKQWSEADPYFQIAAKDFYGIRILNQDPVENIFSFICSSNNNISRISSMVEKLCILYGKEILEEDDKKYYTFPKIETLAQNGVEEALRKAGFGYRAGYISKSAKRIMDMGGATWIENLRKMDYADSKKSLITLTGIGAKVADCICLMSLGHLEAIPVDTHIYQIAKRCYLKHLPQQKTVTEKIYNEIGDYFRKLYGPLAGWAHTVLFCADLKIFQNSEKTK